MLEKIRSIFPELVQTELPGTNQAFTRTQEQDLLIGSSCLTLTDKERDTIANLTFERYQASLNQEDNKNLTQKISDVISKYQFWGGTGGAVAGGAAGGGIAWYFAPLMPFVTFTSGLAGAVLGGASGLTVGGNIGYERAVEDVRHSPEFTIWKYEQYEDIIFPALARYTDTEAYEKINLQCGIDKCFALDPVQDSHGHIFNKKSIIQWFSKWNETWPEVKLSQFLTLAKLQRLLLELPEEQTQMALQDLFQGMPQEQIAMISQLIAQNPAEQLEQAFIRRCPLDGGFITEKDLKSLPNYYQYIFTELKDNYNRKVSEQRSLVGRAKEFIGPLPEEASKVVAFYSKTQDEKYAIANKMQIAVLESQKFRPAEVLDSISFLNSATQLPKFI